MMSGSISELPASGVAAIIVLFLMFRYSMLLLRVTSLLVQLQLFGDMRMINIELTRSVFKKLNGAVLHPALVFSSSGGMGKAATVTYRRLASFLSDKSGNSPYSVIMGWLRSYPWVFPALLFFDVSPCIPIKTGRLVVPMFLLLLTLLSVAEGRLATSDV